MLAGNGAVSSQIGYITISGSNNNAVNSILYAQTYGRVGVDSSLDQTLGITVSTNDNASSVTTGLFIVEKIA